MPGILALATLSAVSLPVVRAIPWTHNLTHNRLADYAEGWRMCTEERYNRNALLNGHSVIISE